MPGGDHPIEGQIVLLAGAKASVTLERLSTLLGEVQTHLESRRERYEREYDRIATDDDADYYLVDLDHWSSVGTALGLDDREADAARRAHAEQFRRTGRRCDREEEFETALEVRAVVVLG